LRQPTNHRRRERLNKTIDGLGWADAYSSTIKRIKAQDEDKSGLGVAALMWVSHAERPLSADELCHALAVELGSKDFNAGNAPSISTLMSCCQGLITVDKETSTARLIHPTVKEYLSTRPDIFGKPHAAMAEICLTYLNSGQVKALSADPSTVIHDNPFLEYCSIYWGIHAKRELSDNARSLAIELLHKYDGHISGRLLLKQVKYLDSKGSAGNFGSDPGIDFPFRGLDCASFLGIVELVGTLTAMPGFRDERGVPMLTPLAWAARNGQEGVVEMLLGNYELYPNWSDCFGLTPLIYAIRCGHERVIEILLGKRSVDPNVPDDGGKTPLSYAAQDGLEGVVKILLGRPAIIPDKVDHSGRTPLSFGAENGHLRVVETLLREYRVNPDKPNRHGQTPLSYAASGGHEEVVKILLERKEVNPDEPDYDDRTPLLCAASGGHEGVVKILLGQGKVNPNKPDNNSQTPLMIATRLGFQEVITLLQSHGVETPAQPEA